MVGEDPLRDMEKRLDRLENRADLSDQSVRSDLAGLREDVVEVRDTIKQLVTRVEFLPVRAIAYGLVTVILTAVATALVAQVVVA